MSSQPSLATIHGSSRSYLSWSTARTVRGPSKASNASRFISVTLKFWQAVSAILAASLIAPDSSNGRAAAQRGDMSARTLVFPMG